MVYFFVYYTNMSIIEVKNLSKHFGKTKAVDDISFAVEKGEVFGFLGPNGAGKTTTIRCMIDFIRPSSGSITLLGEDSQIGSVDLNKKIGHLSGYVHFYDKWTGQDHIDFVQKLNHITDQPDDLLKRLDFDPTIKTKNLSSGNRQKLGIILALMKQPELLIMDEPTNGLDPLLQHEVYAMLRKAMRAGELKG